MASTPMVRWAVAAACMAAAGLAGSVEAKPRASVVHAVLESRDDQGELRLIVLGRKLDAFDSFLLSGGARPIDFLPLGESTKSLLVLRKDELGVVDPGDYQLVMSGRADAVVGVRVNGRIAHGSVVQEHVSTALREDMDDAVTLGGEPPDAFARADHEHDSDYARLDGASMSGTLSVAAASTGAVLAAENLDVGPGAAAFEARLGEGAAGDLAVFRAGADARARIDAAGTGFFDGGAQTGGADFAESVRVDRERAAFGPGDVLLVATDADRCFSLSDAARSPRVAGVVSTKPGVLAMPRDPTGDDLTWRGREVPLAVTGIVPTKVCDEGGPIRRGDLLVTASVAGHAMRAGPEPRPGTVLGKALGALASGRGTIEVLITLR